MTRTLLHPPADAALATQVAALLDADAGALDLHRFPDGESLVTLPPDLAGHDVVVLAGLREPDALAMPLWFTAHTARELGARSVRLIAPYLPYMRQDKRFAPGQAVTAPLFARFVGAAFDGLVTVDPHLHRIPALDHVYRIPAAAVSAAPFVARWLARELPDAVLIGPDSESAQWVGAIARDAGLPFQVLAKTRRGDREVDVTLPDGAAIGTRTPVIVDDIVSSGHTLLETVGHLRRLGLPAPVVVVIHAVFAGDAHARLRDAGVARIVSTDTLPHATNAISIAPALAAQAAAQIAASPTAEEVG
ncbi:MAG: ribose-phosphate diphosphokinase [Pseudomonadota bacterium]